MTSTRWWCRTGITISISTCWQSSWIGVILPEQNLSQVSPPRPFPRSRGNSSDSIDAAAIYVLHKEQYLPSAEAIRTGEGVNDNASLRFEAGKTYKIRIINMSALASKPCLNAVLGVSSWS